METLRNKIFAPVREAGKIIWKKLPRIALYTVAIYAICLVVGGLANAYDKKQIAEAPGTDFLNYTSFTVQNAREGEDVTFTLCRTHKENYSITGTRTVYVVPEGKQEADKVFIYNKDIKGVVDTGNCQPYFIKASEYHFTPGKYLITLNINFKVKYDIAKSVFTKSGIFTIYAQPNNSQNADARLNILQQQLNDQQLLLDQLIGNGTLRTPTSTSTVPNENNQSTITNNTTINQNPEQAAGETPQTREVCDPLLNIFGIRIGSINCRQEPV